MGPFSEHEERLFSLHIPGPAGVTVGVTSIDSRERQRFEMLDELWENDLEEFLDRLPVRPGDRVLEFGCGLGLDLPRLARRVGLTGEVVGVEPNPLLAEECKARLKAQGLKRVRVVLGDPIVDPIPEGPYQIVFCSWKPGSLQPAPRSLRSHLEELRPRLASSGRLGIWELHHAGIGLYPSSALLDRVLENYHQVRGGATAACRVVGELPACGYLFEAAFPRQRADAPGSLVHKLVGEFLLESAQELLSEQEWEKFLQEWEQRRLDPATLVFSPKAMGVSGRLMG